MRRTTKVLLWIVTLLLAVVSAAIVATLLILEWPPRASSASVGAAERTELSAETGCGRATMLDDAERTTRCVRRRDA